MKTDEIIDLLKTEKLKNGVCEIANDNASGQTIVSGDKVSVELFQKILKEKKIKINSFKSKCSFSLHT